MTDTTTPRTHVEHEVASQPACWAAGRRRRPRARRRAASAGRACRRRRLRHVAVRRPGLRRPARGRRCTARRTPSRPASTASVGATTGSWRSPARGRRPRCSTSLPGSPLATDRRRSRRSPSTVRRPIAALATTSSSPAVRRRAVGGADTLPDVRPGAAARLARRGPRERHRGRPPAAVTQLAPRRRRGRPPDHVPRQRLGGGDRRGGGAEVPGGGRLLDRVVPGDGVPPRPDQRERTGDRRVGVRRRRRAGSPATSRRRARSS